MKRLSVLVCCALLLAACEEKAKPRVSPLSGSEIPSQESWNSTVVFSDSAQLKAVLWAGHISVFSSRQITEMTDSIRVDFFDDQEQHTSLLTARRGVVHDATRDLEAYENVIVVSDSGTTLKTERLFWNNATKKIHTDAFVDIRSPHEHIMGHGMESDQGLKHYKIFKVTGQALTDE
ncbi:MAG: LPS export ABC transporter periplasmic protein LptC [Bacteroidetes bacterium]|nr:LPS export ABC transporter periplasmic protein LptC [Bacteroidota bacterium]